MSRTAKTASDLASESSRTHDAGVGRRLAFIRGDSTQQDLATRMGVHVNTYSRWERSEREPSASDLAHLVAEGWNANWLLTGGGPERIDGLQSVAEGRAAYGSQDMSPTDLSMAIQLANEKIAASGLAPTPEQYGKFVLLLYQVLNGGLPNAEVHDFPG